MLQEKEKKESYLVSMNEAALLLQCHWPELYHMATLKLQGRLGKRAPLHALEEEEAEPVKS